jgi:hypothetical protein
MALDGLPHQVLRRELRAAERLAAMELAGMPLDTHELRQHKHAINTRLHAIQVTADDQ